MSNMYRSVLSGGGAATGDAVAADVLTGKTFSNAQATGISGTMPNNGAVSQTINAGESYTIPEGYHNGNGTVTGASLSATAVTVESGAVSFTAEIGKTYVVSKNAATGASLSITGCTVLASGNVITTASTVHNWIVRATATTIAISGASTGGINVFVVE